MGRRRKDAFTGIIALSWTLENRQGTVPAWDDGCLQRSKGGEDRLHDKFPNWQNRTAEQYLRIFSAPRSRADFGAATDFRNGSGLVYIQIGSDDSIHTYIEETDRRSKKQGWRQYDPFEDFQKWSKARHCRKQFAS